MQRIAIQPTNYPIVPKSSERAAYHADAYHDEGLIDTLAEALLDVWGHLGLPLSYRTLAAE